MIALCLFIPRLLWAQEKLNCPALSYASLGFQSQRSLFPAEPKWDGVKKVAIPTIDCNHLAGDLRDTNSEVIIVLFGGSKDHKETWPLPDIGEVLAKSYNLSSLVVDIAGRGESCGYEVGPSYSTTVRVANTFGHEWHDLLNAKCYHRLRSNV